MVQGQIINRKMKPRDTERQTKFSMFPTSIKEMQRLGWEQADVILFTGDAFVDHPAFGAAIIARVLEHAGYQVLESGGPREALCLAATHRGRIGLLLSDVVMPGMNGRDLARRIKALQPRLRTVFMSGYTESMVLQEAVRDPFCTYIQKPFTVDGLLSSVAAALAKNGTAGRSAN